ncbi:MAG TPA: DUF1003 domain-containing protein [Polyangia bacterium]|nr:DUF1003 domain-containing protein [Polyangia bacterium]
MPANPAFLRDISLFQTMDDDERAAIASYMDEARFAQGQQLFHERDQGGICYVLRSGRVEMSVIDESGAKLVVDVLEPGELCGELSLLDGGTRSATAVALTDVETLVLERPELLDFLRKKPDASLDLLAALTKRIRRADALIKQRVQDPNEIIAEQVTIGDRISDAVAAFGGSWRFILLFLGGMAVWVALNSWFGNHWDPYPYILLNLILSMLAALQAPVIMMSQNRQDAKDRIRSEADYRVNVKAEVEIAELHEKIDRLRGEMQLGFKGVAGAAAKTGGAALILLALCASARAADVKPDARPDAKPAITLAVDAREAPRRILHARETVAVAPGALTLVYPKWLPGTHSPEGRISEVVSLAITANNKPLTWRRDDEDMYAVRVDVPAGVRAVDVAFDYLTPVPQGPDSPTDTSARLFVLEWNEVVLYPKGPARDVNVAATLTLPDEWKLGTALEIRKHSGGTVDFKPVTLETLVDSPVIAGSFFKSVPLGKGLEPTHVIDLAADSAAALDYKPETEAGWSKLVAEAGALFGARHYARYHFLLALSDAVGHAGLEHHQSSDNRGQERSLIDDDLRALMSGLLPHEFAHSWNGKYRRPQGLTTPDFQAPMRGELLWVYEGLTTYLGMVLDARSGLGTAEWVRENFALYGGLLDHRPGRSWRPLADTAIAAQVLYHAPSVWSSIRRSVDFYPESALIWLEADALIRTRSSGARSLDDFCKRFHGGASGAPEVRTYDRDEVIATLNAVEPYDWRNFLATRVDAIQPHPPLNAFAASGWRLVYSDKPNVVLQASEKANKQLSLVYSIGLVLREDGTILDAIAGQPAAAAGLAPGMKLMAVNGRRFTSKLLHDAIAATAKPKAAPIEFLVENGDFFQTAKVAYQGGERYPHLERDGARPDLLSEIFKAKSK